MSYETTQVVMYREVLAKRARIQAESVSIPLWVKAAPVLLGINFTAAVIYVAWSLKMFA